MTPLKRARLRRVLPAPAEKSSTSAPKLEAIKIPPPAESTSPTKIQAEKESTSPPRTCGLGPCLDFEKMKTAQCPFRTA